MAEQPTGRGLRIGELAGWVGLHPKTIRYYEEIGLLPQPSRTAAHYRRYDSADQDRLRFILKARVLGLSLEEIREILTLRDRGEPPCTHVVHLLDQKLAAIEEQLQVLAEFQADLRDLREEAARQVRTDACVRDHRVSPDPAGPQSGASFWVHPP